MKSNLYKLNTIAGQDRILNSFSALQPNPNYPYIPALYNDLKIVSAKPRRNINSKGNGRVNVEY